MAGADWLRTFLAVYRTGSVSEGARQRGLSQPAASQQLAALERAIGEPLFIRSPGGIVPGARGAELYAEVAESLDRLESVLAGLEGGSLRDAPAARMRIGAGADLFSAVLLPALVDAGLRTTARFGAPGDLLSGLVRGELDLVVPDGPASRRGVHVSTVGAKHYALVGSPTLPAPAPPVSGRGLGAWLAGKPWVAFSLELPATRRYWQRALGRPFSGDLRLVAPDLRAVLRAVEQGAGYSLLPTFVCAEALADHRVVAVPGAEGTGGEPWSVCTRSGDQRPAVVALAAVVSAALTASSPSTGPSALPPVASPTMRRGDRTD